MELEGRWVHFEIGDAYHPEPEELLLSLYGDRLLQGTVVAITGSDEASIQYAAIDVEGMEEIVVVPLTRIRLSFNSEADASAE